MMLTLYIWGLFGCIGGGFLLGSGERVSGVLVWLAGFACVCIAVANGAFE